MTSNFVPRYCFTCRNILPPPNIRSDFVVCSHCYSYNDIGNNTVVIEQTYNLPKQSISDEALRNLSQSLVTEKIEWNCTECDNDIFSRIHDQNMMYTLVCDRCKSIYNPQ